MLESCIHVYYKDRTGNRLFQFAVGLILAKLSGRRLCCHPIGNFLGTYNHPAERSCSNVLYTCTIEPWINIEACLNHLQNTGDVVVNGYHQHYAIYKPHKIIIKESLSKMEALPLSINSTNDDLVLHLRLDDYFWDYFVDDFGYNLDDLWRIISNQKFERLIVLTDSPEHPYVSSLKAEYNVILGSGDVWEDFGVILNAKRLILTPSTFGWWGGWLGEAKRILFPFRKGIWRKREIIDLWVDDEDRYEQY